MALRALEDLGYYCIDNLPAGLMPAFAEQIADEEPELYDKVAVGIDARNRIRDLERFPPMLAGLQSANLHAEVFFLQADTDTLIQRFSETRRRHPLTSTGRALAEAIDEERRLLEPLAAHADLFIDSSDTNIHELRRLIWKRVGTLGRALSLLLESFAYKHGVPADLDFAFDVRCLPNPYWEPSLAGLSGKDGAVVEFLERQAAVHAMYDDILGFLERWLPSFEEEQRSYVTVGIGCTGGRHRSVYLVERLAKAFSSRRGNVLIHHRELGPEST